MRPAHYSLLNTTKFNNLIPSFSTVALLLGRSYLAYSTTTREGLVLWRSYINRVHTCRLGLGLGLFSNSSSSSSRSRFRYRLFHATAPCLSSQKKNYYDVLGIHPTASPDDIKNAFHQLAKKYHPDINNNPCSNTQFQEITHAYQTLRNSEKRAHYDMTLKMGTPNLGHEFDANAFDHDAFTRAYKAHFSHSFHKIFSQIFDDEVDTFAADIKVELLLSFSEAAKGCTKVLSFDAYVPCDSCHGRGHPVDARTRVCSTCGGVGRITIPPFTSTCSSCKGSGRVISENCGVCQGLGVVEGVKEAKVTIPPGVDSGDTITVPKGGNFGGRGAQSGNLYIRLKVADDPIFMRSGADVYVDANISFTQAILGGKVEVPALSGTISLDIPKGVQPGDSLLLRGRGLPKHGLLINRGDQHVRFRICFPTKVNERQKAILEEFEKEDIIREESSSSVGSWWQQIVDRPKFMLDLSMLLLILLFLNKIML